MEAEKITVIEPELVMPDQFFSNLAKLPAVDGERRLMLAVLEDAVSCYQQFGLARDPRLREEYLDARRWIESRDREWAFSFENICDVLGLDGSCIRDGLRRNGPKSARRVLSKSVAPYVMPLDHRVDEAEARGPNQEEAA